MPEGVWMGWAWALVFARILPTLLTATPRSIQPMMVRTVSISLMA